MRLIKHLEDNTTTPYSIQQLKTDNFNVSFPAVIPTSVLADYHVYPLETTDKPQYDSKTHKVVEGDPVNVDGQWVQVWTLVDLTPEEVTEAELNLQRSITDETQQSLDTFAQTRNYDGILSACTYANSSLEKFQIEGQRCVELRDQTWAALYVILAEVEAGTRPVPDSFADIEGDLPELSWTN